MSLDVVELPIKINLRVQENKVEFPLKVVNNNEYVEFASDTKIDVHIIEGSKYEGEYIITPLAYDDQVLETKNKTCEEDIVVKKVPKWETSNQSGGYTVYIADGSV
jgi:hypothetical protein